MHLDFIQPERRDKLHTCLVELIGATCRFRAHYATVARTGRAIDRYIDLCAEIVEGRPQKWAYHSGYKFRQPKQFWPVPDAYQDDCAGFARYVLDNADPLCAKEVAAIERVAIHLTA